MKLLKKKGDGKGDSPKDDKKQDGKQDKSRTLSIKNIFSFGKKTGADALDSSNTNGHSECVEEDLQYQTSSIPVNIFELNDDSLGKLTNVLGNTTYMSNTTSAATTTTTPAAPVKKTPKVFPTDTRTPKQVISSDKPVLQNVLGFMCDNARGALDIALVCKGWQAAADSDIVWKPLFNKLRCTKGNVSLEASKPIKAQYVVAYKLPTSDADVDDLPPKPSNNFDDDDLLQVGKVDNVDEPVLPVTTKVDEPKPEEPKPIVAPTPAPITTTKPKKDDKVEPLDPKPFYSIDYTKIEYTEEPDSSAVWVEEGGKRKLDAASLNKLIEELTSPTFYDSTFLHTFMLTFRSFMDRNSLVDKLMERFNLPPPKNVTPEEFALFKKEKLDRVRTRVTQTMKNWIESFYLFDFDADMIKRFEGAIEIMEKSNSAHLANMIKRTLEKAKSEDTGKIASKMDCPKPLFPKGLLGGKKKTTNILKWPLLEVARQITLIDFTVFAKIEPKECLNQSWNKGQRETKAPNIYKLINWFNQLSNWVGSQIVTTEDLDKRAKIIAQFIELANHCKELNNFNSLFSIISGMNLASIFRLKETWAALPADAAATYKDLHQYISRDKNFKFIRSCIKNIKPPCIPYIGLYLTDLTFIEDGNPKYINDKINFVKCCKFAEVIRDMQTYQNSRYALTEVPELRDLLSSVTSLSEDEMYKASLAREGRKKQGAAQPAKK